MRQSTCRGILLFFWVTFFLQGVSIPAEVFQAPAAATMVQQTSANNSLLSVGKEKTALKHGPGEPTTLVKVEKGTIHASRVNIRSGPSLKEKVLCVMSDKGTRVQVVGREKDWFQIAGAACKGWVYKDYLTPDPVATPDTPKVDALQQKPEPIQALQTEASAQEPSITSKAEAAPVAKSEPNTAGSLPEKTVVDGSETSSESSKEMPAEAPGKDFPASSNPIEFPAAYVYQDSLTDLPEEPRLRVLSLSLKEAATIALDKNFDIMIEKFSPEISKTGIQYQKGIFDPTISADFSTTRENSEDAVDANTVSDLRKFSTSISKKFEPGSKLVLLYETSDRDYVSAQGRYNSNLKLQLTQSLLKNFGTDINTAKITIAKMEYEQSREELTRKVIEIVAEVQSAYWDYYRNQKDLEVRRTAYDLTKGLFKKKKEEAMLGALAPVDLIEIESRVASKITEYVEAKKTAKESDLKLRALLDLPFDFEGDPVKIQTENRPEYFEQQFDFKKSLNKALSNQPDYRKKQLQMEAKELEVRLNKNQILPDLEAFASYGVGSNDNSWGDTSGMLGFGGGDNFELGLKLSIPLGHNEARSNYFRAWLELKKLKAEFGKQELEIKKNISNARISIEQSVLLYRSSTNNLKLKEKNLKAGEQKLQYGTTTLRELLDIQTELIDANLQLIGAEVSYEKALIDLYKAEGVLDPRLKIDLSTRYTK